MSLIWVIETEVFGSGAVGLIAEIERRGERRVRYSDEVPDDRLPPPGAAALFYGSLNAAEERVRGFGWRPGVIGTMANLECSTYYPHLASLLLNHRYVLTTVEALVARPREVLAPLGAPERVFVRPDSPEKPFSGRVVEVAALSLRALDHGFYYDDASLPVIASPARPVEREWRLVVAGGRVVAGCEYRDREGATPGAPDEVYALARRVAGLPWQPDPIYVLDICSAEGALHVLELNSFSCSDLYACDADAVVEAASVVARTSG